MFGPVAQLGARFHGMEEVDGSNPSRSTKIVNRLAALAPTLTAAVGIQEPLESKNRPPPKFFPRLRCPRPVYLELFTPVKPDIQPDKLLPETATLTGALWVGHTRGMI